MRSCSRLLVIAMASVPGIAGAVEYLKVSEGAEDSGGARFGYIYSLMEYDVESDAISLDADDEWDDQYGVFARIQGDLATGQSGFLHSGFTLRYRDQEADEVGAFDDELSLQTLVLDWHMGYGAKFGGFRWEVEGAIGLGIGDMSLDAEGVTGTLSGGGTVAINEPLEDTDLVWNGGVHTTVAYDMGDTWQFGLGASFVYMGGEFELQAEAAGTTFVNDLTLTNMGAEGYAFFGVRF